MGSTLLGPKSEFSCPTLQGHKAYELPLAFIQAFKAACQTEKWPVILWRHCVVLLHFSLINVWNLFPLRLLDSSQREKWSLKALLEKLSALSIVQSYELVTSLHGCSTYWRFRGFIESRIKLIHPLH